MNAVLSVTSLNALAKQILEANLSGVMVQGEVRSLTRAASGHVYFSLKDQQAEVRCALFRGQAMRVKKVFANGDAVVVRGSVSLYTPRGDYQLIVSDIELAGDGQLAALFETLKKKLFAEGLFDAARKRAIPSLPRRIAVISSAAGAALQDVVSTLTRRMPLAEISLIPVAVQGETAAAELMAAVRGIRADDGFDVVLLVRGGGSMSDLWAFNDEALARAIAACPVPVISGVGHEIDFTITDFVADARAATPTAAAELATTLTLSELQRSLAAQRVRLSRLIENYLNEAGQRLDSSVNRLRHQRQRWLPQAHRQTMLSLRLQRAIRARWQDCQNRTYALTHRLQQCSPWHWLRQNQNHLEKMRWRLQQAMARRIAAQRHDLLRLVAGLRPSIIQRQIEQRQQTMQRLTTGLRQSIQQSLIRRRQRLDRAVSVLTALSPQRVLERGYSLIEGESGMLWQAVTLQTALTESRHPLLLRLHFGDGVVPIEARSAESGSTQ
ncbi:MAG: exodeoxyribonuclease VII large subunit [Novosphingobium sp.]